MKLNNKGFAISTIMYMILVVAVILIILTLSILSARKMVLDRARKEASNDIYNTYSISYRKVLETLKGELLAYADENSINHTSIKVSDLNSSIDREILEGYDVYDKYLTLNTNNDVYLGKSTKVTNINTNLNNFVDVIDYKIYGNSEQNTYTGKNLIDGYINVDAGGLTIPIEVSAGTYWGSVFNEDLSTTGIKDGSTYSVAFLDKDYNPVGHRTGSDSIFTFHRQISIVLTEEEAEQIKYVRFYYNKSYYTGTSEKLLLQLEKGSTPTDYEPYVGGIPSPNPDYPQEIRSVADKNLMGFPYATTNGTYNGITVRINDDGSIKLTGTATADTDIKLDFSSTNLIPGETYTSGYYSNGTHIGRIVYLFGYFKGDNTIVRNISSSGTSVIVTEKGYQFVLPTDYSKTRSFIIVYSGTSIDETFYPFILKGTGLPGFSKNNNYGITLDYQGTNLFKTINTQTLNGVTITDNNDGSYTLNGTCTASANFNVVDYLKAGTYYLTDYISGNFPDNGRARLQVVSYDSSFYIIISNRFDSGTITSATLAQDSIVRFRIRIEEGFTYDNVTIKPVLSKNPNIKESDVTKYNEYIYNIQLDEPLRCIGTNCDYIDFKNGKVVRKVKEQVIQNANSGGSYVSSTTDKPIFHIPLISEGELPLLTPITNYYLGTLERWHALNNNTASVWGGAQQSLWIRDDRFSDLASFRTHISDLYTNETPLIVDYALPTEEEESISLPEFLGTGEYSYLNINTGVEPSNVEFTVIDKIRKI